jgi:hypothetical protein
MSPRLVSTVAGFAVYSLLYSRYNKHQYLCCTDECKSEGNRHDHSYADNSYRLLERHAKYA